jgi:hypothetical protein
VNGYDVNLSDLLLSDGTLSPDFSEVITSYTAEVDQFVTSITITPTVSGVGATVKVNGTTVTSGSSSNQVYLYTGVNNINIVVTAQDNTTKKIYTVVVTRHSVVSITLGGTMTVDENDTAIMTVCLSSMPSADTVVTITSGDLTLVSIDNPSSLTFTPANYNTIQTITLRGVDDENDIYEKVIITASITGVTNVTRSVFTNDDDYRTGILTDTGIVKCYNDTSEITCPTSGDYYGQDANFSNIPAARSFTGPTKYGSTNHYTTKDNVTGFIWKTCAEGQSSPYSGEIPVSMSWSDAFIACEALNAAVYAGRDDWRLPARKELESILNYGYRYPAAIDTIYFPGTAAHYYWTSTPFFIDPVNFVLFVNFTSGEVGEVTKTSGNVRCVAGP